MGRPSSGHRRWAGHGLMVARDSAMEITDRVCDVYPPSLWVPTQYSGRYQVVSHGKLPWGTSAVYLNVLWIPAPGITSFSCPAGWFRKISYNKP